MGMITKRQAWKKPSVWVRLGKFRVDHPMVDLIWMMPLCGIMMAGVWFAYVVLLSEQSFRS